MADLAWLKITLAILYYITLPLTTLVRWLLIPLAPFLHLGGYIWTSFMLPLRLLAKFETLYIYLGVAALIGIFTGTVLHLSSTVLVSLLDLQPVPVPEPEGKGRTAASVRAAREQKKLEEAWQLENSLARSERDRDQTRWKADSSLQKWLEKDAGRRRDEKGVLGQTILEEDDDSEDVF